MGVTRNGVDQEPQYLRNRMVAEQALSDLIETELSAGRTAMIGFDFPFGYPKDFAQALTGSSDPFGIWAWLAERLEDAPEANNRFDVGAEINRKFAGDGPFWFNALKPDIPDLPRKKPSADHGMKDRRHIEELTKGSFTCWQLGGAGSVGSQTLTGLPVLHRLRDRFADQIAVWPFEEMDKPISFVEIWPGLIEPVVKQMKYGIRDAHQVRLLARALHHLPASTLDAMLKVDAAEEGWILGFGYEHALETAALAG